MACDALTAFATATQSLGMRILRYPNMGRAFFWKNIIPTGTFLKNTGVQQTTFTMKPSYPPNNPDSWEEITLDGTTGQPTPACDTNYNDVNLDYYDRLYNPKKVKLRGPVLCRENFTFQHNIGNFLNGYVRELTRYSAYMWEFTLQDDYMAFANWWSYNAGALRKYSGPNAQATVPLPTSDITQDQLDIIASDLINLGVGTDENGWTVEGNDGPIFPLYIDLMDSAKILKNNEARREDARFASMGKGTDSDLSLWKPMGATRVIGNFRHVTTNIAPRFNNVGGVLTIVSPFKDVTAVTENGDVLTAAYQAARYRTAIVVVATAMTAEIVLPYDWQFPDAQNYRGDWQFITGGERICTPPEYDPQHNKGRHFGEFVYAPRPDFPFHAAVLVYKHCPDDPATVLCNIYT